MPQPSQYMASPIDRSRWSPEETLLLLELLLEARRDQQLTHDKTGVARDVFKSFVPTFSTEFPLRQWNVKIIENRFFWLKGTWRAFRAAEATSGTTYNHATGMLQMSKQSAQMIESVHKRFGRYVITKPLPTNDSISLSEWGEIFSTDPPAVDTTIDAHDDQGFARAAKALLREGQGEAGGGTQDNNAGDGSPEEDVSDEDSLDLQPSPRNANSPTLTPPSIARPAASSSRNTPATSTPPNGQPNRLSRTLQQKRITAQSSELSQVISHVFGPGNEGLRGHIIIQQARSPFAVEIEKASKDCQLLFEEFGIPTMMKVILWLKEDTMNPPIWNSLSSKEAKIVLIETILGVELSRWM
ncbi:hypothetical protein E4U19_005660 [Claviceps sp. Clav32 group G5]|nr:hypothetical protein E4U19_005660 [Claviceps sp. Clav32 group G5]KAG6048647.1 hypothetical protein E4U39_007152 [Claviceps sp. Clav50 group G5]